jgi:hypothetical protein
MLKQISAVLMLFALVIGCAHKKVEYTGETGSIDNEKNGLNARVMWLKNKKDMIDINVKFHNNYKNPVFMKQSAFQLTYGGETVSLKNGSGISLSPDQSGIEILHFAFGADKAKSGNATLKIDPIVNEDKPDKKFPPIVLNLPVEK